MKWRVNFVIPNCNYNIIDHPSDGFIKAIPLKNGKRIFDKMYFVFEDGTLTGYMSLDMLREACRWIKDKIISDSQWANQLHKEAEQINTELFKLGRELVLIDFSNYTNQRLWETYHKYRTLISQSHSHAVSTTWFVDSEGELLSNYLRQSLNDYLKTKNISDEVKLVDYFVLLTTPVRSNFIQDEEIEFLQLIKKYKNGE